MADSPNNIEKNDNKYNFKYVSEVWKPKLVKIFNILFTSRILK